MITALSGVVLDGTSPVTAAQSVQNLEIPEGEYSEIAITITGQNGTAFNLTGYELWLTARRNRNAVPTLESEGEIVSAAAGTAKFSIPSVDTDSQRGTYTYDVYIIETATEKAYRVVKASILEISNAMFDMDDLP